MQAIQDGDHWILAANVRTIDANGLHGSRSRHASRVRTVFNSWTGDRWWEQRSSAMKFLTKEAAEKYVDENFETLNRAL